MEKTYKIDEELLKQLGNLKSMSLLEAIVEAMGKQAQTKEETPKPVEETKKPEKKPYIETHVTTEDFLTICESIRQVNKFFVSSFVNLGVDYTKLGSTTPYDHFWIVAYNYLHMLVGDKVEDFVRILIDPDTTKKEIVEFYSNL